MERRGEDLRFEEVSLADPVPAALAAAQGNGSAVFCILRAPRTKLRNRSPKTFEIVCEGNLNYSSHHKVR